MDAIITFRQSNGDIGSGEIRKISEIKTYRECYDGEHRDVVEITSKETEISRTIRKDHLINIFIR